MLNWIQQYNIFCFLDNNEYDISPHRYEWLVGADALSYVDDSSPFEEINAFVKKGNWSFGHLSFEAGYPFLGLQTTKKSEVGFPGFFFFRPSVLMRLQDGQLTIEADDPDKIWQELQASPGEIISRSFSVNNWEGLSKQEYLHKIAQLQQHILRGDCYEINFCQRFSAEDARIDPLSVFQKLNEISPNPFTAFYRIKDAYLLCASPERFICNENGRIVSQPMKGTAMRYLHDREADEAEKVGLQKSSKERAENVMVVDLVRNDLSRFCEKNSVSVEELFGIYSFPNVHQMVSTVAGKLPAGIRFSEIMQAIFPMGSMTGAPKKRVLELIAQYEEQARGLFSGSVGYIDPQGNFDFNVVIRSILYNAARKYLEYQVGSGITFYSQAEAEWEECQLKAAAIKKVLAG